MDENKGKMAESLELRCLLNHRDGNYYRGNKIIFTIELYNNSARAIENIIYHQTFPDTIKPNCDNKFTVASTTGNIICTDSCVIIVIDSLKGQETVKILIEGIIDE